MTGYRATERRHSLHSLERPQSVYGDRCAAMRIAAQRSSTKDVSRNIVDVVPPSDWTKYHSIERGRDKDPDSGESICSGNMRDLSSVTTSTALSVALTPWQGYNRHVPLRVLLVAHVDGLSSRLDTSQFYRDAALARRPGVVLFGPGMWGYRRGMSVAEAVTVACRGTMPDVIVHGVDFKESGVPLLTGLPEASALTVLEGERE